jgi:hypothetical protein
MAIERKGDALLRHQNGGLAMSKGKANLEEYIGIVIVQQRDHSAAVSDPFLISETMSPVKGFKVQAFADEFIRLRCLMKTNLELVDKVLGEQHGDEQPGVFSSACEPK